MKMNHQSPNIHTDTMDEKLDEVVGREAHRRGFVHPFRRGFSRVFRSVLRPFSKIHRRQSPDPNNLSPESFIDRDVYGRGDHTVANDTEASHIVEALHEHQDVPINLDHPFNIKSRSTETNGSRIPAAPRSAHGKSCRFSTVQRKTFLQTAGDDALISPLVVIKPSPSANQSDYTSTRSARRILRRLLYLSGSAHAASNPAQFTQASPELSRISFMREEHLSNLAEECRCENGSDPVKDTEILSLHQKKPSDAPRDSICEGQFVLSPSNGEVSLLDEKLSGKVELSATCQFKSEKNAENRRQIALHPKLIDCVNTKVLSYSPGDASSSNREEVFSAPKAVCMRSGSSGTNDQVMTASRSVVRSKLGTRLTKIGVLQRDAERQLDENEDDCGDESSNSDLYEPDSDALELALESVSSSQIVESDNSFVHLDPRS